MQIFVGDVAAAELFLSTQITWQPQSTWGRFTRFLSTHRTVSYFFSLNRRSKLKRSRMVHSPGTAHARTPPSATDPIKRGPQQR